MPVNLACLIIVLLTAVDVLVVLAFFQRPERGRKGMMAFEILIVCLVSFFSCLEHLLKKDLVGTNGYGS